MSDDTNELLDIDGLNDHIKDNSEDLDESDDNSDPQYVHLVEPDPIQEALDEDRPLFDAFTQMMFILYETDINYDEQNLFINLKSIERLITQYKQVFNQLCFR